MNILERFQTLVAGCLAIIAAIIAYRGALLQGHSAILGAQIQAEASATAVKTQLAALTAATASKRMHAALHFRSWSCHPFRR
jgi:hypothetical protein